ncbi:MAG: hypothetical protein KGO53_14355 [Alphaproteobacteria bacterium]|nr:hypothetical protein [Alphaproteobacteria bacterium]
MTCINDRAQHGPILDRSSTVMEVAMPDPTTHLPGSGHHPDRRGIGFGLFLLLAGLVLLAERIGWLPIGTDWLLPAILIAWGASEVYGKVIS